MAFIASTLPLQTGFATAQSIAMQEKNYLVAWAAKLSGNITALDAMSWVANINAATSQLNAVAVLPGMQAYAQTQFGNPAYDVATAFTAMVNALTAIKTWIVANIPSNSIVITNGVEVGASFTPAQTAPLLALVNAAAATIA